MIVACARGGNMDSVPALLEDMQSHMFSSTSCFYARREVLSPGDGNSAFLAPQTEERWYKCCGQGPLQFFIGRLCKATLCGGSHPAT